MFRESGIFALVEKSALEPGEYSVGIFLEGMSTAFLLTGDLVTIPRP